MKVFFDGGCRGVEGVMEAAVVMRGRAKILPELGHGTSADAEWLALIAALRLALAAGERDIVLIGDSADVVAKARGRVPARGPAAAHLAAFRALAAEAGTLRIRHTPRAQNLAGIALARRYPR